MFNSKHYFKWDLINNATITEKYHIPVLKSVSNINSEKLVLFSLAKYEKHPEDCLLAFYENDNNIEKIWKTPQKYVQLFSKFKAIIGLDYSILIDMPFPQQIYNSWRNNVLNYYYASQGITVIPNVGFGGECTFEWVFNNLPQHSVLAVTSQGCMKNHICMQSFVNGLHKIVTLKNPSKLIIYGNFPEIWKNRFNIPIQVFPSYSYLKWRNKTNG